MRTEDEWDKMGIDRQFKGWALKNQTHHVDEMCILSQGRLDLVGIIVLIEIQQGQQIYEKQY